MNKPYSAQDLLREPAGKLLEESYALRQRGLSLKSEVEGRKAAQEAQKRQREERGERKAFDAGKMMRMFGGAIKVEKRVLDKGAGGTNPDTEPLEDIVDTSPVLLKDAEILRTAALASTLYRAEKDILYASSRFLRTTAKPPLFWKPKLYTRRYEREIDRQEDRLEDDIKPFKKRMLRSIEDAIDAKEEGGSSSSSSRGGDASSSSARGEGKQ